MLKKIDGHTFSVAATVVSFLLITMQGISQSATDSGLLLVVNKADRTLSIVDLQAGRQVAAVPVGGITGHEVAASPDGQTAWVPIYGDSGVGLQGSDGRSISVIDLNKHAKVASVDLGEPNRPHAAVFGPKDGKLYVTAELSRSIKIIDPATHSVVGSISTGEPESHMLAISSDGKRAYTANVGPGTVSVIDLQKRKLLAVIPVSGAVQRIASSADDRLIFTADQTRPQLVIIDAASNTVKARVQLPALGFSMAPTHDGHHLLITHPEANSLSIVNLTSMKVEKTIKMPVSPQEVLIRPDSRVAYVSCDQSKQVAIIDVQSAKIEKLIDVGAGADGLAWVAGR